MDIGDYYWGLYRDPFPHSLLSTRRTLDWRGGGVVVSGWTEERSERRDVDKGRWLYQRCLTDILHIVASIDGLGLFCLVVKPRCDLNMLGRTRV